MHPCLEPGCPELLHGAARCPVHEAKARHAYYTKGNYGRPWRRLRAGFLKQSYPWFCSIQGSLCTARNRQMYEHEVQVDHIIPHRGDKALRDDITNLQVCCLACHSQKTAREVEWNQ